MILWQLWGIPHVPDVGQTAKRTSFRIATSNAFVPVNLNKNCSQGKNWLWTYWRIKQYTAQELDKMLGLAMSDNLAVLPKRYMLFMVFLCWFMLFWLGEKEHKLPKNLFIMHAIDSLCIAYAVGGKPDGWFCQKLLLFYFVSQR